MKKLVLILLACGLIDAAPQAVTGSETTRREDVQAVYTALIKSSDLTYLISSKAEMPASGAIRSMSLESCVVLPQAYASGWTEILAAFRAPGGNELFPADLKLTRPYKLLTAEEVQEFRDDRMQALRNQPPRTEVILGGTSNPKFAGAKELFEFSPVYFNQNRTLAVTFVSSYSSPRSGSWHWTVFEKSPDGRWQERPQWVRCQAVA
jgi:hypothetical protein